jgi:UDP-N-acetylglucosamine 2-epimerase (non-hydrolysing)
VKRTKIVSVVGARPNFMKMAPLVREMRRHPGIRNVLVHTGQHYDDNMSRNFFRELGIPRPRINLDVGSSSHAVQTARIMERFEPVVLKERPDLVLVVGDVNSTLACALVAKKLHVLVGHVEAGLRSFDLAMPEEINRMLTDVLSDFCFTTCEDADRNLLREGIPRKRIFRAGNCMIDTLFFELARMKPRSGARTSPPEDYAVLTLHRPANVDRPRTLKAIVKTVADISRRLPVYFPAHPRTLARIREHRLEKRLGGGVILMEPLSYRDFLALYRDARFVLTDSGGIQEETAVMGVPCITLRENTERPLTLRLGMNTLVGTDPGRIEKAVLRVLRVKRPRAPKIPRWDGKAASRIVEVIHKKLGT